MSRSSGPLRAAPEPKVSLLQLHFVALLVYRVSPPDDTLEVTGGEVGAQPSEVAWRVGQHVTPMWDQHVARQPLGIALHLWTDQLVGAIWQRVARGGEGLPVPAILRAIADRQ